MQRFGLHGFAILSLFTVACSSVAVDEPAAGDTAALKTATNTVLVTQPDDAGDVAEFALRIDDANGKREARMKAKRGRLSADYACSQLANIETDPGVDEVVTTCEEQIRPGYEYVSIYLRFKPSSKRFTYDVIAAHPTLLTPHQHDMVRLFAGRDVQATPPTAPGQFTSHREEADELTLQTKSRGADAFTDPIALASDLHEGTRAPIGVKAKDSTNGQDYTIERITTYANFDSLEYSIQVSGRNVGADPRWHTNYSMKLVMLESPGKLLSTAKITRALKDKISQF